MAGCYHDQEEFESDLTIEVAREDDILKEGQTLKSKRCKKNPKHRDFIPFKDLTLEHLPSKYRNTETLDMIKQKGSRVVRLVVGWEGSGYVVRDRDNNQFYIQPNNHVVKTEDEVKCCTVEFHNDDDSRSSVITRPSRGVELVKTDPYRDFTAFTFHPVPDFLYQLDYEDNRQTLDNLKKRGSRVVRLVVERKGSGIVSREKNQYYIQTNNHVVKTENEVKCCTVEFHYDGDSRSSVITSRGVNLVNTDPYRDFTLFTFQPVPEFLHQLDYGGNRWPYVNIMFTNNQIISREACLSPSNSCLSRLDLNSSDIYLMFISYPDGFIGYINSCYLIFEPIPPNIKESTSVEVDIDEDDGTSRKIRGDVVKFGDDFVVKVPDSITQDKVKKCTVKWNGEVIRARLYFNQYKYKDLYSARGIDEDLHGGDWWEFNFHPKKDSDDRNVSDELSDVCCIGHPHGAIKQITFGRILGESLEKFDNQYRHIKDSRSECQCMEVNCLNYSCKTCSGSSGSPVFRLCTLDYDLHNIHFMGKNVNSVINGEKIENINKAWTTGLERRNEERGKTNDSLEQAFREFEASTFISSGDGSNSDNNEVTNLLLEQKMREFKLIAGTSNRSGEVSNEERQNLLRTFEEMGKRFKEAITVVEQAKKKLEAETAGATASTSNSSGEGSNSD